MSEVAILGSSECVLLVFLACRLAQPHKATRLLVQQSMEHDHREHDFPREQCHEDGSDNCIEHDAVLGHEVAVHDTWEQRAEREEQERRQVEHLPVHVAARAKVVPRGIRDQ
ncbi:hypothetical protein FI667_g3026, partial [Globisporangium splendens]